MNLTIGTHDDLVTAVAVVCKSKVVSCRNPADAAAPVTLHEGGHVSEIGQSADWKHHVALAAEQNDALLVTSHFERRRGGDVWVHSTDAPDSHAELIAEHVRRAVEKRTASRPRPQQDRSGMVIRTSYPKV